MKNDAPLDLATEPTSAKETAPLRVLVVDDSPICRGVLKDILEAAGDIAVVGEVGDAEGAITMARELRPDLVTMDLDMPGVGGLETIEILMAETPTPILVVTGEPVGRGSDLVFEAVNRGALDLLCKPSLSNHVLAEHIRSQVRALARVPVFQRASAMKLETAPVSDAPGSGSHRFRAAAPIHPETRFIAIAAGAGGSRAVATVLQQLPPDLPCPVAVAQHLPGGFTEAYVTFLRSRCSLRVRVVGVEPTPAEPGYLYVAREGAHLVCGGGVLAAVMEPPLQGYRPSATMLLRSAAAEYGDAAVGVVLSGLGEDGAEGIAAMREAGAMTIAEDRHARPDDMPRAAAETGAIDHVIPVQLIADLLIASASPPQTHPTAPPPAFPGESS